MKHIIGFLKFGGKRALVLVVATALALCATVGATVAVIIAKSASAQNTFDPPIMRIALEGYDDIINNGNLPVFVRALAVANWVAEEDEHAILSEKPVASTKSGAGVDLVINFHKEGWFDGGDGFYYYKKPLEAGESIALIDSAYQIREKAGYELRLELLSSAIQAYPPEALAVAWPAVYINADGELASAIMPLEEMP